MNKIFSKIWIIGIVAVVLGGGILAWRFGPIKNDSLANKNNLALSFCSERQKKQIGYLFSEVQAAGGPQGSYTGPSFELNFDSDPDKEIVGVCEPDSWGGYLELFVLDKQNGEYKPILIEDRGLISQQPMRYYKFANLGIYDADQDGIDEIIYEEKGWSGGGEDSKLHAYSPKYKEDFWRDNSWFIAYPGESRKESVTFSSNLDSEQYKLFKQFLETAGQKAAL